MIEWLPDRSIAVTINQMKQSILVYASALFAVYGNLALAADFVWPISNSTTADTMNTSFGPRINYSKWDFHDGIDLPQPSGTDCTGSSSNTTVYAVRGGTVHAAGDAGGGYSSRHVVIKSTDPADGGDLYIYYFHLKSIDSALLGTPPVSVSQGAAVGVLGDDDATYCHLHIEFRKGGTSQSYSKHPLHYLPYTDTSNFAAPGSARFNRIGANMAARLTFGASSKLEGDLSKVEVDLKSGSTLLSTRTVEFDDKTTINEGNGDDLMYVGDIAVEGYQSSDMVSYGYSDLKYGVLVRDLPSNCDTLVARVYDLAGNVATSSSITVPNQTATDQDLDFEDGIVAPTGWTSVSTTGTNPTNDSGVGYGGGRGLTCTDSSTSTSAQNAGIRYDVPGARFQWTAESWIKPTSYGLSSGQSVNPFYFLDSAGTNLSVGARIRNTSGSYYAGLTDWQPDGSTGGIESATTVATNTWVQWKLQILRNGTRFTTGVLSLGGVETTRTSWDSTSYEPGKLRAGVGYSSGSATATVILDDLRLSEVDSIP